MRAREDERWQAIHAVERREAEYRAGVIAVAAISSFGAKKRDDTPFSPEDFFPGLSEPLRLAGDAATVAEQAIDDASGEMDTAATVRHLKRGFARYVPPELREYAGLS